MFLHSRSFTSLQRLVMQGSEFQECPAGSRKLSWPDAVRIFEMKKFELFGRSSEDDMIYRAEMSKQLLRYESLKDYIFRVKFGCELVSLPNHSKLVTESPFLAKYSSRFPQLLVNDFPYFFDASVRHLVLWHIQPMEPESIHLYLQNTLPSLLHREDPILLKDYLFWVNPESLKSIPDIWHAHVLLHQYD